MVGWLLPCLCLCLCACSGIVLVYILLWLIGQKTGGKVQLCIRKAGMFRNVWNEVCCRLRQVENDSGKQRLSVSAGAIVSLENVSVPEALLDTLRIPGSFKGCSLSHVSVQVSFGSILSAAVPAIQVRMLQPFVAVELSSQRHRTGTSPSTPQHVSSQLLAEVEKVLWPPCMLSLWWTRTVQLLCAVFAPCVTLVLSHVSIRIEEASLRVSAPKHVASRATGSSHHDDGVEILCQVGCVAVQPTSRMHQGAPERCKGLQLLTEVSGVGVTCVVTSGGNRDSGKLLQQWRVTVRTQVQLKWQRFKEWYLCCSSDVDMKSLMFHCNVAIFETLKHLSSLLQQHNQRSPYQKYRPCVPVSSNPQAWWKYAGRSVLMHVCALQNEPRWPVHQLCKLPSFVAWNKQDRSKGSNCCIL